MSNRKGLAVAVAFVICAFFLAPATPALAGKKTEAELMAQLASPDEGKVADAMQGLEKEYPDSAAAREKIASMLKDPREKVHRKAARVLGALHADVTAEQLSDIAALLGSPAKDTVLDGLKALRGLKSGSTVPRILPLLEKPDENIKRDACRTLAEIGDRSVIAKIEPLLSDPNKKVQEDARDAIGKLKMK